MFKRVFALTSPDADKLDSLHVAVITTAKSHSHDSGQQNVFTPFVRSVGNVQRELWGAAWEVKSAVPAQPDLHGVT